MTSIDPSQRLVRLLRTQVPAFRESSRGARASHPSTRSSRQPADLASVVAQRIQELRPEDPDRKRKALRIFLESLLMQRLGASIVSTASFEDMVKAVQTQMESDPELAAAGDALSEVLVSTP